MSIQVASPAPSFKTQALVGREFKTVSLSDYAGKWVFSCSTRWTLRSSARRNSSV